MTGLSRPYRRLIPAELCSADRRDEVVYRITTLREGTATLPVVTRVVDGVVHTNSLVPATHPKGSLVGAFMRSRSEILRRINAVRSRRELEERNEQVATICTIIPAHNEEQDIAAAIESLLMQSRPIDLIVVMVNNSTDDTARIARRYADIFPQITVEDVHDLQGRKPGALNYAWYKYCSRNQFSFVLGVDADVECAEDMVEHLERELLHHTKAAGIRAKYSFRIPAGLKRREKKLVMDQRAEFAMVELKQQLRGGRTEILGGQATLFRSEALVEAASETNGGCPWNAESDVEDAELTRIFQRLGYQALVSSKARAWVGAMLTPYAWAKQRDKWETGHLKDMIRDFHPLADRRRWGNQLGMAWNLAIRMAFITLLTTSILLSRPVFNGRHIWWGVPLWALSGLGPIALAILQAVLVASKVPNRQAYEVVRAMLFFPGELYLWKTLSVFLSSLNKVWLDIRRNLWAAQASAENGSKTRSFSVWMVIAISYLAPVVALLLVARVTPHGVDRFISVGWQFLTVMTAISSLAMLRTIWRIVRRFRRLNP